VSDNLGMETTSECRRIPGIPARSSPGQFRPSRCAVHADQTYSVTWFEDYSQRVEQLGQWTNYLPSLGDGIGSLSNSSNTALISMFGGRL
jgi:hypothetical protein